MKNNLLENVAQSIHKQQQLPEKIEWGFKIKHSTNSIHTRWFVTKHALQAHNRSQQCLIV